MRDSKYLHEAPMANRFSDDDHSDAEENKIKEMIDSFQFSVLPPNVRSKAHLLMTYVFKFGKVTRDNAFAINKDAQPISGSNVFDLVNWAEKLTGGKTARAPKGWEEFVQFLSINKAVPQTILSPHTLDDIEDFESGRIKRVKVPAIKIISVLNQPFESLFSSDPKLKRKKKRV